MDDQHPTPLVVPLATVLVVGCDPEVLRRLAATLGPNGIMVRETNLMDLRTDTAVHRPLVLLVDAGLYEFDPEAFDMVAQDVGSKLGVVGSAREAELTVKRLLSAMSLRGETTAPISQRAPLSQRAPVSQRTPPPPSSGEEATRKWSFSVEDLGLDICGARAGG
jgi:hypothetical protein